MDFEFYDENTFNDGGAGEPEPESLIEPLDFFDFIFGVENSNGWVCLTTWPGGEFGKGRGPTKEHWFAWPEHRDRISGFVQANAQKDMYFVPALFDTRMNRKASNIGRQRVVYADADNYQAYKDKLRVTPSIVVRTGPVNAHLYWLCDDQHDPQELSHTAKAIAHAHAESGMDKGGWDGGQLLRVPGTRNNKPGVKRPVFVDAFTAEVFAHSHLASKYPKLEATHEATDLGTMPPVSTWPTEVEMADLMATKPHLAKLYTQVVNKGEGDRSDRVYALLSAMRREDMDVVTMLAAGWYCGSNKYRQEARPPEEFWREVTKAYNDPTNLPAANAWEIELAFDQKAKESKGEATVREQRTAALTFLTPEEQRKVPFDTFIDDYVIWSRGITDAVAQYQRAAAITALSCVYGEYGKAPSKFHLPLTVWFMVMGPSTRSRKTTAMRMMVRLLEDIADNEFFYVLTDDATPEGLAAALKDRPEGVTSLFYRDELHGMIHDEKAKKYLAGFQTLLTQLYDGYNRSRIRAGAKEEKTRKTAVNFPIYGTGVFDNTAESLTPQDFISGHLARFMYVIGEPAEMTPESEWMDQIKPGYTEDHERNKLMAQLRTGRNFWDSRVTRGQPVPIMTQPCACRDMCTHATCVCEDCPWRRWNEFAYEMRTTAGSYEGFKDALEATADRLSKSALKVACLLAMHDRFEYVQMHHLYKAMDLAAEWFQHMVLVANRIKATERRKQQDEILEKVASRDSQGITKNELYKAFRDHYDVGQFEQVLQALLLSGLVHKHTAAVARRGQKNAANIDRYYYPTNCPHD